METTPPVEKIPHSSLTAEEILADYRLAYRSRQASLIGRREVLSGKAKFGIFGDGKEIAQIAMAKAFRPGDFRAGYYRDQTFMFATGEHSFQEFFAQLYANPDVHEEPASAGRQMNAHFATRSLNEDGSWKNLMEIHNSAADLSPTGSQMPKLVGLAYASRLYRELEDLAGMVDFSENGQEIAFGTIGNAACAEGMFWESINAIGVLDSPFILSIWDDGYGISVPNEFQILNEDLSALLEGFRRKPGRDGGYEIYQVKAWDYPNLVAAYRAASRAARQSHVPSILHVTEVTQPQGHSTSGSHERYKTPERLAWEVDFDCVRRMRSWLISLGVATAEDLELLETEDRKEIEKIRKMAWEAYIRPVTSDLKSLDALLEAAARDVERAAEIQAIQKRLGSIMVPNRRDGVNAARDALIALAGSHNPIREQIRLWKREQQSIGVELFGSHLYSESEWSAVQVPEVKPVYAEAAPRLNGFEILNACFDAMLGRDARVIAFGEDVGLLGDVNQAFAGLQAKYGPLRVSDTGIREATIVGQAIGLALRGLRPIAEIQYLDYLLYALQILSDDLSTLHWRTRGGQKAPVIVRTRGHRLEGIWHSGSLMAGIIHLIRGVHVLVPRDMTQAAGFYNTLLLGDEPGLVVEVLNGYRLKEPLPQNIGEFTVPLGVPEVLREGSDATIVTYGAACRIVLEACHLLEKVGVDAEVIDVQSLLPFDIHARILESVRKTNRLVLVDEDVPGGTTAFMLQEIIERQGAFAWLDSTPLTISGAPHRPSYGSDGDFFSKPSATEIFEKVYRLMQDAHPARYPASFG